MARIGIITCSNCTQESNCASVVCLADLRKRRGFFEQYPKDEPLDLIGIINCAGCPTIAAPEKILKRVRAVASYRLDALHLSFCLVALCPFVKIYSGLIKEAFPDKFNYGDASADGSGPVPERRQRASLSNPLTPPNHERFDQRDHKDSWGMRLGFSPSPLAGGGV